MVPMARGAHFDHITGEVTFLRTLGEGPELLRRRDTAPECGQARPEDVRDEHQFLVRTDRTRFRCGLTDLTGRPNQFGVGVTDLMLRQTPLLELGDEVLTREAVVDLAAFATRGTAEGS